MSIKRKNIQGALHVALPRLEMTTPTTWEYRLLPEGFETLVYLDLPEKRITISNTMPWDVFISGLAHGWERYHQDNPEFTHKLNEFIVQQIENGNYTPSAERGEKYE